MRYPSFKVLPEPQSLLLSEIPSSTAKLPAISEIKKNLEKAGEPAVAEYVDLLWVYSLKM